MAAPKTFTRRRTVAELEAELEQRTAERDAALAREAATAEVLQVINASPGDLTPVFDAILEKAHTLCGVEMGSLQLYDGEVFRAVSQRGNLPPFAERLRQGARARDNPAIEPLLFGRDFVHISDMAELDHPVAKWAAQLNKTGTLLSVPLRRGGKLLGIIVAARREVRLFTDKQIALLQNFAAQAVIAMENARLLTEIREALEQQTATAEVLQVINSSPGDLTPVFEAMLEKACQLCEAETAHLMRYENGEFSRAASFGVPEDFDKIMPLNQPLPDVVTRNSVPFRTLVTRSTIHLPDVRDDHSYRAGAPAETTAADRAGIRTALFVPLLREGEVIGNFVMHRFQKRPFTPKQIAVVENFAAQAVIAIENARLITETREALEQQTATAEILRVISSSGTDVLPVFDAIVERTIKLCDAEFTAVTRYHDDGLLRLVATNNLSSEEAAAFHSLFPRQPTYGFIMGRAFLAAQPVSVNDVLADPDYDERTRETLQPVTKYRSFFAVPIIRQGRAIGAIGCARREVRPFTSTQIELVSTFADQAVIAIENARLLGELRDRQAELRVTFDNMADGVAMFDQELRLAAWNRNFQELLDLPDELLAERPGFDTYIRYLTERGEFGDSDPETEIARLRSRLGDHYSFERTRPDGTVIEVRNNPMPDGGVVVIYSDITERKRSEEEIRAARDAAQTAYHNLQAAQANLVQAQKMAALGQLTAGIAHEIKNPLNFVNNFASLSVELLDELKETTAPALATLGEEKRADADDTMELLTSNLEKIAEHGKRADNIVKSMLEHSRGVSGERREVDLNGMIEEALNLAYHGARAQDQSFNISLERDYAQSLEPIELAPQEMTRVFLNLIGNGFYAATKRAQENGGAAYRPILTVATRQAGDTVEVRVRDNGIGIPAEIRDKLFQPFFTTKPAGEGTGLGLSISYDIVTQQHGGTITVESEPGAYTEFTIRLPRR